MAVRVFRQVDIRCSNDRLLMAQDKCMFARENPFHTSRCMLATTRPMCSLHCNGKQSRQGVRAQSRLTPSEPTPIRTKLNHCANRDQAESSATYISQGAKGRAEGATSTEENTNKAVSGAHRQGTRGHTSFDIRRHSCLRVGAHQQESSSHHGAHHSAHIQRGQIP